MDAGYSSLFWCLCILLFHFQTSYLIAWEEICILDRYLNKVQICFMESRMFSMTCRNAEAKNHYNSYSLWCMLTQRESAWEHHAKSCTFSTGMGIIAWLFLLNKKCATLKIFFSIVFYFAHLKKWRIKSFISNYSFRFLKSESSLLLHVTFGRSRWDLEWGRDSSKLLHNAMIN